MDFKKLREFSNGKVFLALKVLSRVFLFILGAIMLFDDLLWDNIGGLRDLTGMAPTMGVVEIYEVAGIHIHHGWVGFTLMFMAGFSLVFIYANDIKREK